MPQRATDRKPANLLPSRHGAVAPDPVLTLWIDPKGTQAPQRAAPAVTKTQAYRKVAGPADPLMN